MGVLSYTTRQIQNLLDSVKDKLGSNYDEEIINNLNLKIEELRNDVEKLKPKVLTEEEKELLKLKSEESKRIIQIQSQQYSNRNSPPIWNSTNGISTNYKKRF